MTVIPDHPMKTRIRPVLGSTLVALGPTFLLLSACSGGGDSAAKTKAAELAAGPSCVSRDTTPVSLAVRDFIKTASPTAQRYLSAAGTDSAVPEDGFKVLQDKGPTYFYGGDDAAKAKIREKLASVGPYASLLVVFRGKTEAENGNRVTVRLGGHYIGGEHEGKVAPGKAYEVQCDTTGWKIATTTPEPGA